MLCALQPPLGILQFPEIYCLLKLGQPDNMAVFVQCSGLAARDFHKYYPNGLGQSQVSFHNGNHSIE